MEKIKDFFRRIFGIKEEIKVIQEPAKSEEEVKEVTINNKFNSDLQNAVVDELEKEAKELFKMFRNKEIQEEDLTDEQKTKISDMYDKEIEKVKKSIAKHKENILKYREELKKQNKAE